MADPPLPSTRPPLRWACLTVTLAVLVLGAWVFRDVVFRGGLLSHRDSLQFYYPLFDYIQQEWEAGRIPLWNPYDNGGQPLLAAPTSSVLYPLKGVFFLPVSYWARYHLYVLLHVVMAGASCGWVARRWGASRPASTLAALSYAYCGNVLFQYCNVVFLCGAAWLPLALWCGDRMLHRRSPADVPGFAVILAMMTLAGDAQLAYIAGMLVALEGLLLWRSDRRQAVSSATSSPPLASSPSRRDRSTPRAPAPSPEARPSTHRRSLATHRLTLLGASAVVAGLLSAAQVLPTIEFSKVSVRAAREAPLSLYDIPRYLLRREELVPRPDTGRPPRWYDGLIGDPPPPAKHESNVYGFSHEPWRIVEYLWPNIGGRRFSEYHRWAELLGWQESAWVDSNYMGLLPILLALSAWSVRRTEARTRWLSWTALLMMLASFGIHGPGQWFSETSGNDGLSGGAAHSSAGAVGGLYWLLVVVLPGFAEFRYPSKLLVPAACALSVLAAAGFDRFLAEARGRWTRCLGALAAASAAIAIALWPFRERLESALANRQAGVNDAFRAAGAFLDIEVALWHTAAIGGVLTLLTWVLNRQNQRPQSSGGVPRKIAAALRSTRLAWTFVVVTGVDLAVANSGLVDTIDRAAWERTPELVESLRRAAAVVEPGAVRPPRVHRPDGWSYPLRDSLSDLQIEQYNRWQRTTLYGLQNLPYRVPRVFSVGSIESNEQETWFDYLLLPDTKVILQPRRAYDAWGCRFFVLPTFNEIRDAQRSTVGLTTEWTEEQKRFHRAGLEGSAATTSPAPGDLVTRHVPLGDDLTSPVPGRAPPISTLAGEVQLLDNASAFPPAWIVHRIVPLEPIPSWNRKRWLPLMISMVFPQGRPFDLHAEAYVEDHDLVAALNTWPVDWPVPASASEDCRITRYDPDEVEIEATLAANGVVVLSDTYADGWTALVSSNGGPFEPQPVLRTNRTMRGVLLGPGRHVIRYRYVPRSFYIGAIVSLLSTGGLIVGWVLGRLRRRRVVHPS